AWGTGSTGLRHPNRGQICRDCVKLRLTMTVSGGGRPLLTPRQHPGPTERAPHQPEPAPQLQWPDWPARRGPKALNQSFGSLERSQPGRYVEQPGIIRLGIVLAERCFRVLK